MCPRGAVRIIQLTVTVTVSSDLECQDMYSTYHYHRVSHIQKSVTKKLTLTVSHVRNQKSFFFMKNSEYLYKLGDSFI